MLRSPRGGARQGLPADPGSQPGGSQPLDYAPLGAAFMRRRGRRCLRRRALVAGAASAPACLPLAGAALAAGASWPAAQSCRHRLFAAFLGLGLFSAFLSVFSALVSLLSAAGLAVLGLVGRLVAVGDVALVLALALEVGLVPAAALQAEHRGRDQLLQRRLLAARALLQRLIGNLLQGLDVRTCSCGIRIRRTAWLFSIMTGATRRRRIIVGDADCSSWNSQKSAPGRMTARRP